MTTTPEATALVVLVTPDEMAHVVQRRAEQLVAERSAGGKVIEARNTRLVAVPTATTPMGSTKHRVVVAAAGTWGMFTAGVAAWAFAEASLPTWDWLATAAAVTFLVFVLVAGLLCGGAEKILVWGERVG